MIQKYFYFTILSIVTFFITSCSLKVENKGVSHQVWIPWPNADGQYRMQKIQVDSITKWSPIRGSAAKIRSHYVQLDEKQASSSEVIIDYTTDSSGAVVPMTQFSLEVASIYANFDRLQKLDQKLALENSTDPRNVYVKFKMRENSGEIMTNNALYNFLTDSFYVVPYTDSRLPLSVNGAVLAHEHFHSVFGRLIQRPLYEYGQSKNVDLFKDYTIHDDALFKKEFKELFSANALHGRKSVKDTITAHSKIAEHNPNATETDSSAADVNANTADTDPNTVSGKVFSDADSFAKLHLNKIFLMALNEGLADVWAWLYSNQSCFIAPSLDLNASIPIPEDIWAWLEEQTSAGGRSSGSRSKTPTYKLDDHDNRCLNTSKGGLAKKTISSLLNKTKFTSVLNKKIKSFEKEDFSSTEKQVVNIMGYRLGTNLARLFYHRLEERNEIFDSAAQFQWAKHITTSLPTLVSKMKTVYIDELRIKTLFPWDETVDLLLFGDGTPDVPKENCQSWVQILRSDVPLENFKKKCSL